MSKAIVSFFDQFPEYNGRKIEIRGKDGYVCAGDISKAINKRFSNWKRTGFAQEVLEELSLQTGIPIDREGVLNTEHPLKTPLIDYVRESGGKIFVHPSVAFAYSMSEARFFARISIWLSDLATLGTVNPHILQWTKEEYQRGLDFNRDDIKDMYG